MTIDFLTPDLLLALAKVTILLLIGFALNFIIKTPRLRALIWSSVFATLIPLLFLAADHPFSFLKVIPAEPIETVSEPTSPAITPTPVEAADLALSTDFRMEETSSVLPEPTAAATVTVEKSAPFPFLAVYLAGGILCLIPLLVSWFRVRRLETTEATGLPLEVWRDLGSDFKKPPTLHFLPSPASPFATGIRKQMIYLPAESTSWSRTRLTSTLLHEAAHHHHRDPLVRAITSIVRAVLWFHPLVWLARHQLIGAQEQSCDQFAITRGIEPADYAEDLLAAASHSNLSPTEALAMARWSQIGNRIRYILDPRIFKSVSLGQFRALMSVLIAAVLVITSIGFVVADEKEGEKPASEVVEKKPTDNEIMDDLVRKNSAKKGRSLINDLLNLRPKKHDATTVVQVHPAMLSDPLKLNFMAKEFEAIVAPETLNLAAKSLRKALGTPEETVRILKSIITTHSRRGTDFIEINVRYTDKNLAVKIANAVTDAYLACRNGEAKEQANAALKALDKELALQAAAVKVDKDTMTALIKKNGLPFSETTDKEISRIILAIEELEKIDPKKSAEAIKELHARKKKLMLGQTKEAIIDSAIEEHLYRTAKERYEQSRDMYRGMKIKQQEQRVLLKMPRTLVTIHKRAK